MIATPAPAPELVAHEGGCSGAASSDHDPVVEASGAGHKPSLTMPTVLLCDSCGKVVTASWPASVILHECAKRGQFCGKQCALAWLEQQVHPFTSDDAAKAHYETLCERCDAMVTNTEHVQVLSRAHLGTRLVCRLASMPEPVTSLSDAAGKDEKTQ